MLLPTHISHATRYSDLADIGRSAGERRRRVIGRIVEVNDAIPFSITWGFEFVILGVKGLRIRDGMYTLGRGNVGMG